MFMHPYIHTQVRKQVQKDRQAYEDEMKQEQVTFERELEDLEQVCILLCAYICAVYVYIPLYTHTQSDVSL